MQPLVDFMLRSVATEPDQLALNVVEGDASVLYEVVLSDADRARLFADDKALLHSIQAVLSASSGRRRAVIEVVDELSPAVDADAADTDEDDDDLPTDGAEE